MRYARELQRRDQQRVEQPAAGRHGQVSARHAAGGALGYGSNAGRAQGCWVGGKGGRGGTGWAAARNGLRGGIPAAQPWHRVIMLGIMSELDGLIRVGIQHEHLDDIGILIPNRRAQAIPDGLWALVPQRADALQGMWCVCVCGGGGGQAARQRIGLQAMPTGQPGCRCVGAQAWSRDARPVSKPLLAAVLVPTL